MSISYNLQFESLGGALGSVFLYTITNSSRPSSEVSHICCGCHWLLRAFSIDGSACVGTGSGRRRNRRILIRIGVVRHQMLDYNWYLCESNPHRFWQ